MNEDANRLRELVETAGVDSVDELLDLVVCGKKFKAGMPLGSKAASAMISTKTWIMKGTKPFKSFRRMKKTGSLVRSEKREKIMSSNGWSGSSGKRL